MRGAIVAVVLVVLGGVGGAIGGAALARADDFRAYDIEIIQPWLRAPPPGATDAAVFMKLSNTGDIADRLLRVSVPTAERVELQAPAIENDEIKTRPVHAIELPPGAEVMLQPGGFQVLLSGLKEVPAAGTMLSLTLTFERGGMVDITAIVTDADAMGPPVE